jgi:hypothetical protein
MIGIKENIISRKLWAAVTKRGTILIASTDMQVAMQEGRRFGSYYGIVEIPVFFDKRSIQEDIV